MRQKGMEGNEKQMILLPRYIVEGNCSMQEFMDCVNGLAGDIAYLPVDDYLIVMQRVASIMLIASQAQIGQDKNDVT